MNRQTLDFSNYSDNIYAMTKMLGHLGGKTSYGYYTGQLFAWNQTERTKPLVGMIGLGVNRLEEMPDGSIRQLGKELCYYTDLDTGEIIERWHNPITDKVVETFHVRNHAMNMRWTTTVPEVTLGTHHQTKDAMNDSVGGEKTKGKHAIHLLPWQAFGDIVTVSLDVMLKYPNPLSREEFSEEWSGETVNPSEHMCFYTSLSQLEDRDCLSADYKMVLTRLGVWLPWMKMGQLPGHLFYRAHAWKLKNGIEDIPKVFLEYAQEHDPEFLEAPENWTDEKAVSTWEVYANAKRQSAQAAVHH